MAAPPTVVLVDDSADLRELVRAWLDLSGGLEVVAEGATGLEAIDLAQQYRPDLMLLDVSMPVMDGLEALPKVRAVSSKTRVVMFTGFEQQGLADHARELGATALWEKSMPIRSLSAELVALLASPHPALSSQAVPLPVDEMPTGVTESVLDEHRERFREVFEEAAIGMATMTLSGHLVRANKALVSLIGPEVLGLVGRAFHELAPTRDRGRLTEQLRAATVKDAGLVQFEHGMAGKSPTCTVRTTLAPICDSNGVPLYLFAQLEDVSEQRAVEGALRQSEERFRLLVEAVTDHAIFMLDPEGRVQSWNAGAERMKGYTAQEILGEHIRRFYPVEVQRAGHPEDELRIALRDGRYEEEGWRVRKDGTRFWANVVITAIHEPGGHHVGFAKITRDVTERRRTLDEREVAASALKQANEELAAANERLADTAERQAHFLAVTAHELRTPISILVGTAEVLNDAEVDDEQRERLVSSMAANAARLRRLLDDLLTAARLDAQAMVLQAERISLGPILRQSVESAESADWRHPDKTAVLELPPTQLIVSADAERLGQIVDNLVNNAMNHGEPPVRVTAIKIGPMIEVRVSDSGPGVPAAVREQLFDRYVTATHSGTGLGLFIVRELARAHGGDAWYEHSPTPTFVVSLPAAD